MLREVPARHRIGLACVTVLMLSAVPDSAGPAREPGTEGGHVPRPESD